MRPETNPTLENNPIFFTIKSIQKENGEWVTVGGTGTVTTTRVWSRTLRLVDGSPSLEWDNGSGELRKEIVPARNVDCAEEKAVLEVEEGISRRN